jgi:hypothetical protein
MYLALLVKIREIPGYIEHTTTRYRLAQAFSDLSLVGRAGNTPVLQGFGNGCPSPESFRTVAATPASIGCIIHREWIRRKGSYP